MKIITGNYKDIKQCLDNLYPSGYFMFDFTYCTDPDPMKFREIDRFLFQSKKTLRFKNEYSGNVVVDLTEWNDGVINNLLDKFMYFLKDRERKYHITFVASKRCSEKLYSKLNEIFECTISKIDLPISRDFCKNNIGFIVNNESEKDYVRK